MASWLWPSYVSPDLPLTLAQRKAINREAWRRWMKRPWNIVLYLLLPGVYFIMLYVGRDTADRVSALIGVGGVVHRLLRIAVVVVAPVACFVVGGSVLQRIRFAPLVWQITREHGFEVCSRCGYWLRGLDGKDPRCPECGAISTEGVGSDGEDR